MAVGTLDLVVDVLEGKLHVRLVLRHLLLDERLECLHHVLLALLDFSLGYVKHTHHTYLHFVNEKVHVFHLCFKLLLQRRNILLVLAHVRSDIFADFAHLRVMTIDCLVDRF